MRADADRIGIESLRRLPDRLGGVSMFHDFSFNIKALFRICRNERPQFGAKFGLSFVGRGLLCPATVAKQQYVPVQRYAT